MLKGAKDAFFPVFAARPQFLLAGTSLTRAYSVLPWWLKWKSVYLQCRRPRFDPWVGNILWRRQWHPTPVLLPGKSHGRRSMVGCSPWGRKESDTTERLHFHFHYLVLRAAASSPHASLCQLLCGRIWKPCLMLIHKNTSQGLLALHLENAYQAEIDSRQKDSSV